MKLVIAEKPSVALSIAKVLGATKRHEGYMEGGGYLVSWCFGHLLGLADPEMYDEKLRGWSYNTLPIIPDKWMYGVAKDKKKQLYILSDLMKMREVDSIVCATDAGREGELIFRLVYYYSKCNKPVERLWISSMEDEAIRKGFAELRPGSDYDMLYQAALCRAQADWIVGINATRLFTVLYGTKLNVGRVMSPTLALLVQREAEIHSFKSVPFYVPEITCGGFTASGERTDKKNQADQIRLACDGRSAMVQKIEIQKKTEKPPKLYDLTTLQRECNRIFGFTAQQTLDYLQSLYEMKLSTYPRTDSRYLTEDMHDTAQSLITWLRDNTAVGKGYMGNADIVRIMDNKKVTDHHAIIPTMEITKTELSELPKGERCVLELIAARLLCATAQPYNYEATTVTLDCAGHIFTAKGKTVLQSGWKEIERLFLLQMKKKPSADEAELPKLSEGQVFDRVVVSVREGKTAPPKHYTEDSLLSAMETAGADETPDDAERKGLGTPATRAAILEKLVFTGFVERRKKLLVPTQTGINLIKIMPDNIKSPLLTAEWESKLKQIERGELSAEGFMNGITDMITGLVQTHDKPDKEYLSLFPKEDNEGGIIGVCPRCGSDVVAKSKGFFCDNRSCTFALWKDNYFFRSKHKKLTKSIATVLLSDGRAFVEGLYSEKKNKNYDAFVVLDDTGGKYVNFKIEFPQRKDHKKGNRK